MRENSLLSVFTYISRYSRPDLGCMKYEDSFRRLITKVLSVSPSYHDDMLFFARNRVLFPSMRGIQFLDGVLTRHERLFNCAGIIIDSWKKIHMVFYLLLCGCGVGFNISKRHVGKLTRIVGPDDKESPIVHIVEDSVLGWAKALDKLIESYTTPNHGRVVFNYSMLTPKGRILRSCGRGAPGPEPLVMVLENVRKKLDSMVGRQPKPIDVYDIICMSSQGVVAGGVRRSALIAVFDHDDEDMLNAKIGDWFKTHPYRSLSNNSFIVTPDMLRSMTDNEAVTMYREMLQRCLEYGEPGVVHIPSHDHVVNPCCEIVFYPWVDGVSSYQLCNLTEVSVYNANYYGCDLERAIEMASVLGTYQAAMTSLYDDVAIELAKRDALLGVSLTGLNGYVYSYDWRRLAKAALDVNDYVSRMVGIRNAARVTCIKPSGTVSCVAGNSSGIHPWFDTGIRNVGLFVNEIAYDAYVRLLKELGVSCINRFIVDNPLNSDIKVCPFPYTAMGNTWKTTSAMQMLSDVLYMTDTWIRSGYRKDRSDFHHSVSCTVMFNESEIEDISRFLCVTNKKYIDLFGCFACTGLSFLARNNRFYSRIAPFCSKDSDAEIEEIYYSLLDIEKKASYEMVNRIIDGSIAGHTLGEMNGGCDSESCYLK